MARVYIFKMRNSGNVYDIKIVSKSRNTKSYYQKFNQSESSDQITLLVNFSFITRTCFLTFNISHIVIGTFLMKIILCNMCGGGDTFRNLKYELTFRSKLVQYNLLHLCVDRKFLQFRNFSADVMMF